MLGKAFWGAGKRQGRTAAALFVMTVAPGQASAREQEPNFSELQPGWSEAIVHWDAPPECPPTSKLVELLQSQAVPRPGVELPVVAVDVAPPQRAPTWRADLHIAWAVGSEQRTLQSESCAELAQMVAVVLGVALDGAPVRAVVPPQREHVPEAVVVSGALRRPVKRSHRLRPGAGWDVSSSGYSWGLGLAYAWVGRAQRVELGVDHWRLQPLRYAGAPAVGADIREWLATSRACLQPRFFWREHLELPLCVGAEAGVLRSVGVGVVDARPRSDLWLALEGGVGLVWWVRDRVAVSWRIPLSVPLLRHRKHLDSFGPIYETGAVSVRLRLGIEVALN